MNIIEAREKLLELSYNQSDQSSVIQRDIIHVNKQKTHTIFTLNNVVPNIKNGKFSCEKWEAILKEVYLGETKIGYPYEVYNDFTPNLKLALPSKGSISIDIIIKEAFFKLDSKIKELEDNIKNLKKDN